MAPDLDFKLLNSWNLQVAGKPVAEGERTAVYVGHDNEQNDMAVIKLWRPQEGFTAGEARFDSLMSVHHPSLVIFDQIQIADNGVIHSIMEFVDGPTLNRWIEEHQPLTSEQALAVISEFAAALDLAAKAGIHHGDLRPHNVLLRHEGEDENTDDFSFQPKIADLGACEVFGQKSVAHGFSAPEVQQGGDPTTASDLYSLGCMLYFMLSGFAPFQGASDEELLQAKLTQNYQKLTPNPPFGDAAASVIDKLLQPEPKKRFGSYGELRSAISRAAEGPPAEKKSGAPIGFIGAAAVLVVLALGGAALFLQGGGADESATEAPGVTELAEESGNAISGQVAAAPSPTPEPTAEPTPEPFPTEAPTPAPSPEPTASPPPSPSPSSSPSPAATEPPAVAQQNNELIERWAMDTRELPETPPPSPAEESAKTPSQAADQRWLKLNDSQFQQFAMAGTTMVFYIKRSGSSDMRRFELETLLSPEVSSQLVKFQKYFVELDQTPENIQEELKISELPVLVIVGATREKIFTKKLNPETNITEMGLFLMMAAN